MELPKFLEGEDVPFELNPNLKQLGTETAFGFGAQVMQIEKSGKFSQVYKFHVGDTGPKTPEPIIDVAIQALKDKQTKYGHFLGYPQIRKNIAEYFAKTRNVEIDEDNVIIVPGGKPTIELAIQVLVGGDGYVVGQNPGFPIYESLSKFYTNGKYMPWLAKHNQETGLLEFNTDDLAQILENNDKIRLLIINTPQNPTGMILSKETLEKVAELVKKHKIMVLFDDIYDRIIFEGREHFSILSVPGMLDYTINLNGCSKDFAMTGWRIGFAIAPKWLIKTFGRLAINKWSCVSRVNQIVAGVIFGDVEVDGFKYKSVAEELKPILEKDYKDYEQKGRFLVEALEMLRPYVIPNPVEGAFYDFPNIEKVLNLSCVKDDLNIKNENEFADWLLNEKGFACLAGPDFGEGGRGHIRLSYAEDKDLHIVPGIKYFIKVVLELIEKSGQDLPVKIEEVDEKIAEIEQKMFV